MKSAWNLLFLPVLMSATTAVAAPAGKPVPNRQSANVKTQAVQIAGSISDEDYPVDAIRNGENGTVTVQFVVSANGRVPVCEVTQSSGSESLDEKSCEIVKARFEYTPARDAKGKAVSETRIQRITWRLPGDPRGPEEMQAFDLAFELVVSPDGTVKSCNLLKFTGPDNDTTTKLCPYMKNRRYKLFEGTKDRRLTYRSGLEIVDVP